MSANETTSKYAGHTPGPWGISGGLLQIRTNVKGGGMRFIAHVAQPETNPLAPLDAEALANARLIADAPTLLAERDAALARAERPREALEDMVNRFGDVTSGNMEYDRFETAEILSAARAALAAAGKESP